VGSEVAAAGARAGQRPHVRWIFAQRLAGHSVASIARALNERGVPCPSGVDPERNRHRSGAGWTLRTVAAILANPRHSGRQVWNRQQTSATDAAAQASRDAPRWTPAADWVISKRLAHTALVSETDFIVAQAIRTNPTPANCTARTFLLARLVC
jgi:site-specific DNA recombinase